MENRTFLQMDKTTSESEIFLGDFVKRSENSNLYCNHHLLLSDYHKKQTQIDSIKLRDTANIRRCFA